MVAKIPQSGKDTASDSVSALTVCYTCREEQARTIVAVAAMWIKKVKKATGRTMCSYSPAICYSEFLGVCPHAHEVQH